MDRSELIHRLHKASQQKIVFLIADGLGGISDGEHSSELESANTPNLDRLASNGVTGMFTPVAPGITSGSGPGHLAIFGYDPLEYNIGRGVLTALGVDYPLEPDDVAARGNFCTVDKEGNVVDRRAGRISSERGAELVRKLQKIDVEGVELCVKPVKEHRFLLVLKGLGRDTNIEDTDPQTTGVRPKDPTPQTAASEKASKIVAQFLDRVSETLGDEDDANMVLLRGFDSVPEIPDFHTRYGLKGCGFAGYPMYRGMSRLIGLDVADCEGDLASTVKAAREAWGDYDFFFLHDKATDSAGEDGNYDAKVAAIEGLDQYVPQILDLNPDVLVVTGDHSTPSQLKRHSWHSVPVVLRASSCRRDDVSVFGETACTHGGLGHMPMVNLMGLALAHAGRLQKYGA